MSRTRVGCSVVVLGALALGAGCGGGGKCANPGDGKIFGAWRATADATGATGTYTLTYKRTTDLVDTVGSAVLDLDLTYSSTERAGCHEVERLSGSVALQGTTANHVFASGLVTRTGCTDPNLNVTNVTASDEPTYQAKLTAAYSLDACELTIGSLVFARQ